MWPKVEYLYRVIETSFPGTNCMQSFLEMVVIQKTPLNRDAVRGNFLKNQMPSHRISASSESTGPSPFPLHAPLLVPTLNPQHYDLDRWGSHDYAPFQMRSLKFFKERGLSLGPMSRSRTWIGTWSLTTVAWGVWTPGSTWSNMRSPLGARLSMTQHRGCDACKGLEATGSHTDV